MDRAYPLNPTTAYTLNQNFLRTLQSWGLAALVTLLLILLMSRLIAMEYRAPTPEQFPRVENIHLPELQPTVQKFQPPERVVAPEPQPLPPRTRTEVDPGKTILVITPPAPGNEVRGPILENSGPVPIFKPAPRYPATALRRGIEGYVVVEFSIGLAGNVLDPVVVGGYDSAGNPTEIFNRAAVAAVARFKYRPQLEDGKPVVRHGVRNRIRFKLAN
ncbi:energy transducer TonB [Microbulbifer guangxiensis]|uniref:energy transducer TonB n=1 Tax=Microbulbifer guangxiensis TaxID=2904249 RepID=UPI001F0036F4|nr:energy transducer TonB [Microbulbifer guangxiensis]